MLEAYLRESPDLVHEGKHACGQKVIIFPLFLVPIELVDAILLLTVSLETIFVFPTSPSAGGWMKQQSLLVLLRDIVEEVLCDGKLTVELFETESVILQEQKAVLSDCSLYICDQLLLFFLVTVQFRKVDGLQLSEVVRLFRC